MRACRSSRLHPRRLCHSTFIQAARSIGFERGADFITDAPEYRELLLFASRGVRWIVEGEMMASGMTGEHGARLVGLATDGDHGVDARLQEFIEMLGTVLRDVDADLRHRADGEWMDVSRRLRTSAGNLEAIAKSTAQDPLSEMRPATVAGAENQDQRFGAHEVALFVAVHRPPQHPGSRTPAHKGTANNAPTTGAVR